MSEFFLARRPSRQVAVGFAPPRVETAVLALMSAAGLFWAPTVRADDPAPAFVPLQILQQQTVDVGSHRIIFNRVVPPPPRSPSSAAPTPTPTPTATASTLAAMRAVPKRVTRAAGAVANAGEESAEPRFLSLSATVYDGGRITELRGSVAAGGWRAWSNVDFLLLAPVTEFGVGTTTYALNMGLGTDTSDWLTQAGQYPAAVSSSSVGQATYHFADGATAAAHPEAATALDALHRFVDANRPALLQARQRRAAEQAAHEAQVEQERLHPTPTPDTTINFWPKAGSVFLGP